MLSEYKRTGIQSVRDKLFELCVGFIIKCLKTNLRYRKRYESETQVLTLAWDVFLKCVSDYNGEVDLANFIGTRARAAVRWWIKHEKVKKNVVVSLDTIPIHDTIPGLVSTPFYAVEELMTLKDFRRFIPDEYRVVFDDALCSFDNARKFRQTRPDGCAMSSHRYYEAKRMFQFVIEFFLRG